MSRVTAIISRTFFISITVLLFLSKSIYADVIYLNDGRIFLGKVKEYGEEHVVIENDGEHEKIAGSSITNIVLGFEGDSFCYQTRSDDTVICEKELYASDTSGKLYLSEPKTESIETLSFEEIREFEIKPKDSLNPFKNLQPGWKLSIKLKNGSISTGTVTSISKNKLLFNVSKKTYAITRNQIQSIVHRKEDEPKVGPDSNQYSFSDFILPGAYQYRRRDQFLGISYVSLLTSLTIAAGYEYSRGRQERKKDEERLDQLLLFNQSLLMLNYSNYETYSKHYNNNHGLLAGIAFLFLVNSLDILLWKPNLPVKLSFYVTPEIGKLERPNSSGPKVFENPFGLSQISFSLSHSF
ncbi:hypothetical protein CH373_11290 [Leptospira perolatii]|uniref:DUF5683 domain-containing protein n=1 Tax=Leptospira perolatii TaxID=2023191 RepID=A0A2M9ZLW2_9LEPT|nr:hypothetical protein [Leptospira perolatii]PJZ69713.1 hypothetical protein CH360_08945 [Leptospira perolatii]PJZ73072.1 hypothetical protein CH373_11290 [Leptospira perolatii]